jgi:hypothetical protein
MTDYSYAFLTETLDYLNITLYLGIMLQSSQTYGSVNDTINREISYFRKMATMMDNTNNKLSGGASVNRLESIVGRQRVAFVVQLGVIIVLGMIAYVAMGDQTAYQPYIFAVVGLLVLLSVFIYMHNTTKYVRTDSTKFYWQRPTDLSVLDKETS